MARKIEMALTQAVTARRPFKDANTEVLVMGNLVEVYLWGSLIARKDDADALSPDWRFNLQGYNTATTRSRLKALGCDIGTRKGVPYVGGVVVPLSGWFDATGWRYGEALSTFEA